MFGLISANDTFAFYFLFTWNVGRFTWNIVRFRIFTNLCHTVWWKQFDYGFDTNFTCCFCNRCFFEIDLRISHFCGGNTTRRFDQQIVFFWIECRTIQSLYSYTNRSFVSYWLSPKSKSQLQRKRKEKETVIRSVDIYDK